MTPRDRYIRARIAWPRFYLMTSGRCAFRRRHVSHAGCCAGGHGSLFFCNPLIRRRQLARL